jgi:hypothetical protein
MKMFTDFPSPSGRGQRVRAFTLSLIPSPARGEGGEPFRKEMR